MVLGPAAGSVVGNSIHKLAASEAPDEGASPELAVPASDPTRTIKRFHFSSLFLPLKVLKGR